MKKSRTVPQSERQEKLRNVILRELAQAEGADSDEVTRNRDAALAAYNTAPLPGDREAIEEGWSTAQSTDVRDMLQACLGQIMPMLATDAVIQFEPNGANDEDQARAESAAVDHVIMDRNAGFIEFEEAIHDALLLRNGWTKVYCDTNETVVKVPLDGNEDKDVLTVLQTPRKPTEKRGKKGDKVIITTTEKRFSFNAVPIENMFFAANSDSSDVDNLRFLAELMPDTTRSDLVERGIPKRTADQLATKYHAAGSKSTRSRRSRKYDSPEDAPTRDQDKIETYEVHVRLDLDEDGISELWRCLYAGGYVFEEEVDVIPYATGSAFLNPHRVTGQSLYDNLWMIQNTKTDLLRRSLDNASVLTYGRYLVNPKFTNLDDFLSGARAIRTSDITQASTPLMQGPDLTPSMLALLQYQDKRRTEAGGASLDMQSAELQVAGETAHGVERQTALREMLTTLMAHNLAHTLIKRTFLLMHRYMREYANEPIQMKLQGQWVAIDPQRWPIRDRMNIKAGMSIGQKMRKMSSSRDVINLQIQALQFGMDGVVTDLASAYNAMMDWAAAADIDNPDLYFINPSSPQSQQAQQSKQQAQQQADAQQQEIMMGMFRIEMQKIAANIAKDQQELAYKYWSDRLKSETEEMKVAAQGTIDLEKAQLQGEQHEREATTRANGSATSPLRATNGART